MILNSKNNQFVFKLPKGFLDKELQEKYSFYLKRLPTPFSSIEDYINHSIQSVTFPQVNADILEQTLDKRPQFWRQSFDLERVISKEFTVNFKTADGFLNYWIMFEQLQRYLNEQNMRDYFPDMELIFLDRDGYQLVTVTFRQPLMKGLDTLEMTYASVGSEFKTFGVTFHYNLFEINVKLD
jgi:hypothetical protein